MDEAKTAGAESVFLGALDWLGHSYGGRVFHVQRDVVYATQRRLCELVESLGPGWRVYNDYPMLPSPRRSISADLALEAPDGHVAVVAEFKYEPCHSRNDILPGKLPVTAWVDLVKDTTRIGEFVAAGRADIGYAVCIDEGGYYRHKDLSIWGDRRQWHGEPNHRHPIDVLIYREVRP